MSAKPYGFDWRFPVAVAPGGAYTTANRQIVKREVYTVPDEDEDAPTVIVVDEPQEDTPVVETGDTTVIVADTPADNSSDITPLDLDVVQRLAILETRIDALEGEVFMAEVTADVALSQAEDAQDAIEELADNDAAIIDAVDEADAELIENIEDAEDAEEGDGLEVDPIEPVSARVHPLFRPAKDWFGR